MKSISSDGVYVQQQVEVNCGNHYALSCQECPQEHGASWCHGECIWSNNQCLAQAGTTSFFNSIIIIKILNTCVTTINVSIAFPDYVPTDAPATGLDIPAVLYYDTQH